MKSWPQDEAAHQRSVPVFWLGVTILVFATSTLSANASAHKSTAWSRAQFETATHLHEALDARASEDRSRADYQRVLDAYRRVYFGAPNSPKAEPSVAAVAQLLAEMGRGFEDRSILRSAIAQYQFLRRQYPGGKGASEALLAIGQIYKDDLADSHQARQAFEEFVARYPRNRFAGEARQALAEIAANGKTRLTVTIPKATGIPQLHSGEVSNRLSGEASKSAKVGQVTGIRTWSTPDSTRVAIDLERDVQYESQRIDKPKRIVFDLLDTKLSPALIGKTFNVDDEFLKRIRLAQTVAGRTRIVLEVDEQSDFRASQLDDPPRLMIDIHADQRSANANRTGTRKPLGPVAGIGSPKKVIVDADDEDQDSSSQPASDAANQRPGASATSVRAASGAAQAPVRLKTHATAPISTKPAFTGDPSLIRALGLKIGKIVIDPGHGGFDTGTIGPHGLEEKDVVLDVGRRLGKLLQNRLGAEVVFTRKDDTFIPLETRTAIANQEQADLFVSIHANSSRDTDARGVETYYLSFTSSPDALEQAARENAVSAKSIHELQDLVKKIALHEKIDESREFASDVQSALHHGLSAKSPGIRDRGVKKAPFIVLIGANMPSILAEISFVSNPGDERKLETPEYRQRIAESLYRGIFKYVNGLGVVKIASRIDKSVGQ